MDYLQYLYQILLLNLVGYFCFKPCYKWITFNTLEVCISLTLLRGKTVLNLVINGLPSIPKRQLQQGTRRICFKPCYKWITFNTRICFIK